MAAIIFNAYKVMVFTILTVMNNYKIKMIKNPVEKTKNCVGLKIQIHLINNLNIIL